MGSIFKYRSSDAGPRANLNMLDIQKRGILHTTNIIEITPNHHLQSAPACNHTVTTPESLRGVGTQASQGSWMQVAFG